MQQEIRTLDLLVMEQGQCEASDHGAFLAFLPPDVSLEILTFLSVVEWTRLGQTSTTMLALSGNDVYWQRLYEKEKPHLLPFLTEEDPSSSFSPSSHRPFMKLLKVLQNCLSTLTRPDTTLLKVLVKEAFCKGFYRHLTLATLCKLTAEPDKFNKYATKILCAYPEQLFRAIYFGQGFFSSKSKKDRLRFLEEGKEKFPKIVGQYLTSALISGDIDERTPLERFQVAYELTLNGDTNYTTMVIDSLKKGTGYGQEERTLEERFRDLERLAEKGICGAIHALIESLCSGSYGTNLSEEERYQKLKFYSLKAQTVCFSEDQLDPLTYRRLLFELVPSCDYANAQVVDALLHGRWGHGVRPFSERLTEVEDIVFAEQEATTYFNMAGSFFTQMIENGSLEEIRQPLEYLEELAKRGLKAAQNSLAYLISLRASRSSRASPVIQLTDSERMMKLESYVTAGYPRAVEAKCEAVFEGRLGMDLLRPDERFEILKNYADQGIKEVVEYLEIIINNGGFTTCHSSFDCLPSLYETKADYPLSPKLLLTLREQKALKGDKRADAWTCEALFKGTDGNDLSLCDRLELLREKALAGSEHATKWIVKHLISTKETRDAAAYLEDMEFWAVKGDKTAQETLVQSILRSMEGPSFESSWQKLQQFAYSGMQPALEQYCLFLVSGCPVDISEVWPKERRLEELERLSEHHLIAQKALCNLFDPWGYSRFRAHLSSQEELSVDLEKLLEYGDKGNKVARSKVMGLQNMHKSESHRSGESKWDMKKVATARLNWISKGDFSCWLPRSENTELSGPDFSTANVVSLFRLLTSKQVDEVACSILREAGYNG